MGFASPLVPYVAIAIYYQPRSSNIRIIFAATFNLLSHWNDKTWAECLMFKKSMVIKWLAYIAQRQPRVERKLKFIKNIFLHKLSVNERQTCRQCFDIYFKYICLYKMDWGYSLWSLYWPCHELGMDMFQRLHIYSNMMDHLVLTAKTL